jgi:hypothetical protein
VQDSEKLGLHHVHLRAPDPAVRARLVQKNFGGETAS